MLVKDVDGESTIEKCYDTEANRLKFFDLSVELREVEAKQNGSQSSQ